MLKRLRIKIVCVVMAIVTVLLCVIFSLVIHFTKLTLEQESTETLQQVARMPGFRPDGFAENVSLPYFIMMRDARGSIKISGRYIEEYSETVLQEIWSMASTAQLQSGEIGEYDLEYMRFSGPFGEGFVFVDVTGHRMALESLGRVCIMVGSVSFVVLLGLSILLSWWIVKPVEKAWQQQRQFVADASHELKTPLTVIMTNAELMRGMDQDDEARLESSGNILTMSKQMRGLVEGLLELARMDNGAVKTSFEDVDLSGLVSDGILPFEALYFEKGLTLSSDIQPGVHCRGSVSLLGQVLEILLDNAMKYSQPAGEVWVRLSRQGKHSVLSVTSPGESISREELKNIFKRFYRINKARTRDGSYGLGLSIAQSIVSDHRGKIWAESAGGWNTFFVQLPVG